MKKILLMLMFISVSIFSAENFYYVSSLSGLRVRESPSIDSKTLFILPYKTSIKILEKGKSDLINNKRNNWYYISFYNDTGWVFGEYLKSPIPSSLSHKYVYKSGDNNYGKIFFILFNDNTFSIYVYSIEDSKSMILYGAWYEEGKYILFRFNKRQNCDPECNPNALFDDRRLNITVNNEGLYKMLKDVEEISIWNLSCFNVNHFPPFQYE